MGRGRPRHRRKGRGQWAGQKVQANPTGTGNTALEPRLPSPSLNGHALAAL